MKDVGDLPEIKQLHEWIDNRHEYAKKWKKSTGGKIVGYFCTYVPEEILYAAGILPVRMLGSHEPESETRPYLHDMFCPFSHDVLAQGLRGRYDYLDGIAIAQSCLHLRQSYWIWERRLKPEWAYYLPFPHGVNNPHAVEYTRQEFEKFKLAVEKWLGKKIRKDDLDRAVEIYNKNRQLLKQLYELRKRENPPITGLHAIAAVVSSQVVDKEEHNKILESLIEKLKNLEPERETGTRLMIVGSEDDDRDFFRMVEYQMNYPATFVFEEHCTGARYFWNEVEQKDDVIGALAERYVYRIPCPSKDWATKYTQKRRRFEWIEKFAKEWNIEGAIIIQQKFCDPHELDIPALRETFNKLDIPVLFLEFDLTVPVGQFRTRVEAFMESISEEALLF